MHDEPLVSSSASAPGDPAAESSASGQNASLAPGSDASGTTGTEPPPLAEVAPKERHPFAFHGSAAEYFRIWIVNTLLTLLTLGVFAAWAKVRKRRYLRGSTSLMGHRFDYRADPRRLLVGHVIVAVAFLAYAVFGEVYPKVRIAALAIGALLLPWLIVRSLSFNADNTTYRGLRFTFRQTYGRTALTYFGGGLLVLLSVGALYPGWMRSRRGFVIGSHRLGDASFRFEGATGHFYLAYLLGAAVAAGGFILGAVLAGLFVAARGGKATGLDELAPLLLLYGAAFYIARHLTYGMLFNHVWNQTRLDAHHFIATLSTHRWLILQIQNLLAIIGTAGLAYPWAVVRSQRYALSCLHFVPAGPVEWISRSSSARGSAVGDSATEFIGLDVGL
jgi:uncharacterized membrane protein YjgN (DUF898 family)